MHRPAVLATVIALIVPFVVPLAARGETPKACDLLSAKKAASLLGGPVDTAPDSSDVLCAYSATSGGLYVLLTVTDGSLSEAEDFIRNRGGAGQGEPTESIPGLGDRNLFIARAHENSLTVFWHQKMVILAVKRDAGPALKAVMVETMRQVLTKL